MQLDVLDDEIAVVGELEPRRDAAVVVERGDDDLVAGAKSRPAVRENVKFSEVMFGPKVISCGSQPRKRAAFASARSRISLTRKLVS